MAKRAGGLPGYLRLPGTARHYRTPSGREITRREYQNRLARRQGYPTESARQRDQANIKARNAGWDSNTQRTKTLKGRRPKIAKWRAQAPPDLPTGPYSRFEYEAAQVTAMRAQLEGGDRDVLGNRRDSDNPALVAPNGPLAQLLAMLGIRDLSPYAVGDTP